MISTFRLGGFELRRFRGPIPKIALIFLILVPLMYGVLYLWSNWDPYGRLDQVPVAVVNQDQPATVDGKTVNAGAQFVDELKADRIFDWHFTDAADAADGLAHGRYYLTITVPKDFSANLASGSTADPKRAVVLLHRDDVNGYVIGLLTSSVQTELTAAIDKAAVGTYFDAFFGNLATIRQQTADAAKGAQSLADGLDDAKKGSADLSTGLTSAKSGSAQLVSGLADAKAGSAKLATGAADAKAGADKLSTGLDSAATGSADLAAGIDTLKSGSATLVTGANQVAAGNKKLADTVVPILDKVAPILPKVAQAGTDVTGAVADVTALVSTGNASLTERATATKDALDAFKKAHPELANDPAVAALQTAVGDVSASAGQISTAADQVKTAAGQIDGIATTINQNLPSAGDLQNASAQLTALADGSAQVADGAQQLDTGLGSAQTGAHTLADGIASAETGAQALDTGLGTLATGAADLDAGIGKLSTGAQSLDKGLATAQTGAASLATGIGKLDTGAHQLATGLTNGVNRIPVLSGQDEKDAVSVLSSPADAQVTIDHPATFYGRGLAPFFFAIALWVFGISVFLVMRPITGRALAGRASAARLAVAGWLPVGALAVTGSLILLAVSWFALRLDPVHAAAATGVVVLAAVCFSIIAHLLRTALGTVGSAITLVLLMVQLTSAGGLYPVETLPLPFRVVHPFIPMTYLVDALRITFTGGPTPRLWRDVAVLAVGAAAALGLCIWVVSRRKRFTMKDLHPVLG